MDSFLGPFVNKLFKIYICIESVVNSTHNLRPLVH